MSSGADETLLGFDTREMFVPPDATWNAARRDLYLLRRDVQKPLSVDVKVWPSTFDAHEAWRGAQNHWADFSQMQLALTQLAPKPHSTVAVTCVSGDNRAPTTRAWRLLGFDIADEWLTSGLSNCGYEPELVTALRASWTSDLNEHHLFTNVTKALAFRERTNRRVPEHAPFFVYGLYVIAAHPLVPTK